MVIEEKKFVPKADNPMSITKPSMRLQVFRCIPCMCVFES